MREHEAIIKFLSEHPEVWIGCPDLVHAFIECHEALLLTAAKQDPARTIVDGMISFLNHSEAFYALLPEVVFAFGIMIFFFFNSLEQGKLIQTAKTSDTTYEHNIVVSPARDMYAFKAFFLLFIILLIVSIYDAPSVSYYINDYRSIGLKIFVLLVSLPVTLLLGWTTKLEKLTNNEYFTMYLFFILGVLLTISAHDFMFFYIPFELQFFCTIVMIAMTTRNIKSDYNPIQAAVMYFIINCAISAMMLYGISHIYGLYGTTNFTDIRNITYGFEFTGDIVFDGILAGSIFFVSFIILSILLKLGVVPLQFWMPSTYEKMPLSTTIVVSTFPKIVLVIFLVKIYEMFGYSYEVFEYGITFLGVLTVIISSIRLLKENRLKSFIIISSFVSTGLLIVLLGNLSSGTTKFVYYYLMVYTIITILNWSTYTLLIQYINSLYPSENILDAQDKANPITISRLSKMVHSENKNWGYFFVFFLLSLSGLPVLSAFLIKFISIGSFVYTYQYFILGLTLLISSISTFYYVRIVRLIADPKSKIKGQEINFDLFKTGIERKFFIYTIVIIIVCIIALFHSYLYADFWLAIAEKFISFFR